MRQHIGKALQTRSAAIKAALERYNAAASALIPPRRTLEWSEVINYTFLAEFDLLRDARQDISQRPWATPAGRMAMDLYFKVCRAPEEIDRCDIEIRRICTFLHNEERYLRSAEEQITKFNQSLAYQVRLRCLKHERFAAHHHVILAKLAKLPGFSGTLAPGISVDNSPGASGTVPDIRPSDPSHTLSGLLCSQTSPTTSSTSPSSFLPSDSDSTCPAPPLTFSQTPASAHPSSPADTSMMEVDNPAQTLGTPDRPRERSSTVEFEPEEDTSSEDENTDAEDGDAYEGGDDHSVRTGRQCLV